MKDKTIQEKIDAAISKALEDHPAIKPAEEVYPNENNERLAKKDKPVEMKKDKKDDKKDDNKE